MRRILFLLILPFFAFSQQTINDSIIHDSVYRNFITYIPAVYDVSSPTPLLFNFHGRTGTAYGTMWHADFRDIADTANFIIVHPQGLLNNNGDTHWNYGHTNIDDIGFLNSLYFYLITNFNIDVNRVYSAGMSNGGAMSYYLACDMSDKIAAIASVTGAMTSYQHLSCSPTHPTPVMEIHGTNDSTVSYSSMIPGIYYWRDYNNCNYIADTTIIPDIVLGDFSTVEHIVFNNGDNGVTTELFKVINGEHTWPGSNFSSGITNFDINASVEIWKFFSKYDINGLISTSTFVADIESKGKKLIKVVDVLGKESLPISNTPLFYIFDDGSVDKKLIIK